MSGNEILYRNILNVLRSRQGMADLGMCISLSALFSENIGLLGNKYSVLFTSVVFAHRRSDHELSTNVFRPERIEKQTQRIFTR